MREPTEFLEALGQRIREAREKKHWSLKYLASKTDLSTAGIWAVEKVNSSPHAGTILRLCLVLGISPNKLILGKERFEP
jgi:transcriptional regulator with XRE-family HTH domain